LKRIHGVPAAPEIPAIPAPVEATAPVLSIVRGLSEPKLASGSVRLSTSGPLMALSTVLAKSFAPQKAGAIDDALTDPASH
jgi:hypothetical protein